jgi:hypothetical protein
VNRGAAESQDGLVPARRVGTGAQPIILRPGRTGLLVSFVLVALTLLLAESAPTSVVVVDLADSLLACAIGVWFLMNRYTITIDQKAVTVSTALWRIRGLPALRFSRHQGISVTCSHVFWHRAVIINGAHVETPDRWSYLDLVDALDDPQVSLDEPDATLNDRIGMLVLAGVLFAGFLRPKEAPFALAIIFTSALALMLLHSYRVDRKWQDVLDDLAATIPPGDR